MKSIVGFIVCILLFVNMGFSQSLTIPLWEKEVPNSKKSIEKEKHEVSEILRISKVQVPSMEVFLPAKRSANGKAVIICPGGGYGMLAYDWEGTDVAKWFNSQGIAAFVLKYRLPQSKSIIVQNEAPLQDAQRAIRQVRYNAEKWNIDKNKIGVIGFSAGGHLASTLGTHYNYDTLNAKDDIDKLSARPDFMMLIYPVITMHLLHTHKGSRNNLLGKTPSDELVNFYSNELHINNNTPPTFIVHSTDDKVVPVENSLRFFECLKQSDVFSELHVYPYGGHGFGLAIGRDYLQSWTQRLADWLLYLDKI